jgi:hypothetical protein
MVSAVEIQAFQRIRRDRACSAACLAPVMPDVGVEERSIVVGRTTATAKPGIADLRR